MLFRSIIIVFTFIFFTDDIFSQNRPPMISIDSDAPEWMHLIDSDDIDIKKIKESYETYYKTHPFQKNTYTQYYKRFMRWARPYTDVDGKIVLPTNQDLSAKERAGQKLRNSTSRMSNWTFAGPNETWHTDGNTKVTWQTNIYCIDIAPSNANILYAGGETGGLWRTEDKGLTWTLMTKDIQHGAFGAVKIHPSNPNIVYAGTGGKIIKTTNGGNTWTTVYSENNLWANEIAISTSDPNIVLAATDQGLIRTTNGGTSWTKLHSAQVWTIKQKEGVGTSFFIIRDSGTSSEFLSSTDSGASWTIQTSGWWQPTSGQSVTGAIIATCPSNTNKVYAYLCGNGGTLNGYVGVFVSTNGGSTWANANGLNLIGGTYSIPTHTNLMANNGTNGFNQGFYDMAIVVNPSNENELIAGGTSWFKSTDGGATWNALGGYVGNLAWSHPDIQWLAAMGSDLWIASDGGLNYSSNFGVSMEARMDGISGSDMWGFASGWNTDLLVGGRYHNGNMAWHESFPSGKYYRLGGAESPTGYVNPGPGNKVMHSDIGGHKVKSGFGMGVDYFSVGAFPNESYAYYANSDMVFHPNYYNTILIGKDNHIMKSTDGGTSFAILYTFPGTTSNQVYEVQIARSNPDIIYCSQWDGVDDKLWKSVNGGTTWTAMTPLPLPNNNDRVKMAVSAEDADILWVAVTYGSNGKKIYKSINGGTSWINMTTSTLDNFRITNIMAQYGTNGGIYLGTEIGVFYRNNTHSDWQPFSIGLPLNAETNRLKPFYRDGKIRNGCWGFGVWESPLFESSQPQAMPSVNAKNIGCTRDTVYFDDYSVLNHTGATWQWSFPGASYVSSHTARNPKVMYPSPGTYDVALTITDALSQSSTRSIPGMIIMENKCAVDSLPGKALSASGTDKHAYVPDFNKSAVNTLTVTAWIKPNGIQPEYTGIFMGDGNDAAGLNFKNNNQLAYHWPNGAWWWDSNIFVPSNEWSFVALVVKPNNITVYCNEQQATHNFTVTPTDIPAFRVGSYRNWGSRNMNGSVDEVAIYDRALTTSEIRELRHLTKKPESDPTLIAYYQFNSDDVHDYDKVNTHHIYMTGGATKVVSGAPIGSGVSQRMTVNNGGLKDFANTGLRLYMPSTGTYPNGELVVSRLNLQPNILPSGSGHATRYWIINNYGSNSTFTEADSVRIYDSGNISGGCIYNNYTLFKRATNSDANVWNQNSGSINYDAYDQPPYVTFHGSMITSAGQLTSTRGNKTNGSPMEICNGIDDDCNGLVDEVYSLEVTNPADSGPNTLRAIMQCAQAGEIITFASNIDTITLASPLLISKNISWLDDNGAKVVIRGNLNGIGFNAATSLLLVPTNIQFNCQNIHLSQTNNTEAKPLMQNFGQVTMTDCKVSGNPDTILKQEVGAVFHAQGLVEVK